MKFRSLSLIICSLLVTTHTASAFPSLSGLVSIGSSGGKSGSNISQVVVDCSIALDMYLDAQVLLIRAIAGKEELAARQATIDFVQNGDAKKASNQEKAKMGRELDESLNRIVLENKPLDLIAILEESILAVKPIAHKRNIVIKLSTPQKTLQVIGDKSGLQQVFIIRQSFFPF
jgi:signal transduction histidine kinase